MRPILVLLLAASISSMGCSIADELNSANAEMDRYTDKSKTKTKAKAVAGSAEKPTTGTAQEKLRAAWSEITSLAPGDIDPGIVRCSLKGRSEFMRRDDCLSRGGVPSSAIN